MFKTKYTISILDSKWSVIKNNAKLLFVPRINELIYMNNQYYKVLNVIHMLNKKHDIFIIVDVASNQEVIE
jgi:hypothetical protein